LFKRKNETRNDEKFQAKSKEPTLEEGGEASSASEDFAEELQAQKKKPQQQAQRFANLIPKSARVFSVCTPPGRMVIPFSRHRVPDYEERRQRAETLRDIAEQTDLARKFLLTHRKEINHQHVKRPCEKLGRVGEGEDSGVGAAQTSDGGVGCVREICRLHKTIGSALGGT
jgi:hypothetical protein